MEIKTSDYEKLGSFYLGREYDIRKKELLDELVLYDSKDLVTHGVVLGMTGSGKTGLCLGLLEEAALDNIPAIVIDPKGDIANLMLTFPDLKGSDFRPWINEDDASKKGISPDDFAQGQAELWKNGLEEWGQDGERVREFRNKVDINIYTPGSSAGIPVSILSSLDAPPFEIIDDAELLGERIESSVSSILSLMGIDADPIQSKEHILISQIFHHCWTNEENLSLEKLIQQIQEPPFSKVGVVGIESFYPEGKRMELAMQINNLLASPKFAAWLSGESMDVKRMLHDESGKPRISIFSIAHLGDAERMFFVSLLLNQVLGWMRSQSGTTSLRAMLYMDEIYGYLPPTANPPSKKPLLTMLKQARAFGLGVLVATQNPVDLDYKALSNMGTWFLGRLQTERDKMRVLDGLEGAASTQGSSFNRQEMEEILAGLGSRVFLVNNVHEDGPAIFHVRWVMSYLRGPLTRRQIKTLMDPKKKARQEAATEKDNAGAVAKDESKEKKNERPILPSGVDQYFLRIKNPRSDVPLVYTPAVLRSAEVYISDSKLGIDGTQKVTKLNRLRASDDSVDWDDSIEVDTGPNQMDAKPFEPCSYAGVPGSVLDKGFYKEAEKDFENWIYREGGMEVFKSPALKMHSKPGESEGDFRVRLQEAAREVRDEKIDKLREKHGKQAEKLEDRIKRAEIAVEKEKNQARTAKISSIMSIGSAVLGAFMGRKLGSVTNMRRGASSMKSMGRAYEQGKDIDIAEDRLEDLEKDVEDLSRELEDAIEEVKRSIDPMSEELANVRIKPLKKNIDVKAVGIAWLPAYRVSDFELEQAWK